MADYKIVPGRQGQCAVVTLVLREVESLIEKENGDWVTKRSGVYVANWVPTSGLADVEEMKQASATNGASLARFFRLKEREPSVAPGSSIEEELNR